MMFWRSVVGKLSVTILLLFSFVLTILTVLLLEFFDNYHIEQSEKSLRNTGVRISHLFEEQEENIALEVAFDLLDEDTFAMIVKDRNHFYTSPDLKENLGVSADYFLNDSDLSKVITNKKEVKKMSSFSSGSSDEQRILIIGVPMRIDNENGAVFIMKSLEAIEETKRSTTNFILLAAAVAIFLTTIFAFFLSTRITSPLRKMKEAAFEAARGKFDVRVPILTHDEIGELATAFNQMSRQLKFNMNALRQEKEQLASILSSMVDGVITFNRDGTILTTNPPAERFLQYWYYEQNGKKKNIEELPPIVLDLFDQAVNTEKEQIGEINIQGRSWVVIVSPLYNLNFIRGAVAVVRDMTEERQLDKLRKDFIANVSHELRTPISMMQGYSEAILDGIAQTEEEKKELIQVIYDESLRMGRLVNELLDLARMEAGHSQLSIENVIIEPYIQRIIRKFQGLAKEKEITITSDLKEAEPYFRFDPDRIEQVFTNLIGNALNHTPKDGIIFIKGKTDNKGLYIDVTNTGSFISEEDLPFVFERFYKVDKARTRGRTGTGLGLAIAKNIIESHKGHISVQSKKGFGTTFSFFIPRTDE